MKRQLLIEVDCGEVTCQGCEFYDSKGEACEMFTISLVDDCVRDPRCVEAEAKARVIHAPVAGHEETNDEALARIDRIMRDEAIDAAFVGKG
jgi:hypothetical protein